MYRTTWRTNEKTEPRWSEPHGQAIAAAEPMRGSRTLATRQGPEEKSSMKLLAASIFALITGCTAAPGTQGGSAPDAQDGVGSGATPHLEVRLTDAPAAFQSVFVSISRIEIGTASDGWITLSDQPQQFDLLTLQNDATALL